MSKLYRILIGPVALNRFPTFCATLVGGYTFIQIPLRALFESVVATLKQKRWQVRPAIPIRASRATAAFLAAWFSLKLLNTTRKRDIKLQPKQSRYEVTPGSDPASKPGQLGGPQLTTPPSTPLVGKTMDLTLFAVTRLLETVIADLWSRHKTSRISKSKWTSTEALLSPITDAGVFALSAGTVMWAWFYLPERLPRAYNQWIQEAAQVDHRLIEVLRKARWGKFVYGKETGVSPILQGMCKDYGWPLSWGDPAVTIPIPCEMVHMGAGSSCHYHAALRFARAFKFALATYLPLQILVKARGGKVSLDAVRKACNEALRSSTFLGAFIGLFYYGVCLSRTQLGPKLFNPSTVSPMMWDAGLCVQAGCMLCGFSILIEAEKKRQEVAMFVAPRAVATLLPRVYEGKVGLSLGSSNETSVEEG